MTNCAKPCQFFFDSLHIWYQEILSNLIIFRLRLLFLEFKKHSATRSWSCFLNKIFDFFFAIALLSLFWISIVIYFCFSKTNVQFTPTPWTACNGVKKVERWQVCPSEYYVFAPISNPNCDCTPTFFHFVFLPLLFQNEASMYDIITSWQISWFSDFVCFFKNLKTIWPHVHGRVSWTKCSKFFLFPG